MKPILDIKDLKQGQKMIEVCGDGRVNFYTFMMIHSENDKYVFLMNMCKTADRFYKDDIYKRFYTDYSDHDLIMIKRNHALKMLEECDKALAELGVPQEVKTVFEVGDVVRIVQCPMYPEYIGSVGRIVSYVTSNGQRLYKVERNNKLLRGYALSGDLRKVKEV